MIHPVPETLVVGIGSIVWLAFVGYMVFETFRFNKLRKDYERLREDFMKRYSKPMWVYTEFDKNQK